MSDWWLSCGDGKTQGPLSTQALVKGIVEGQIPRRCYVCRVGDQQWLRAAQVDEIWEAVNPEPLRTNVTERPWFLNPAEPSQPSQPEFDWDNEGTRLLVPQPVASPAGSERARGASIQKPAPHRETASAQTTAKTTGPPPATAVSTEPPAPTDRYRMRPKMPTLEGISDTNLPGVAPRSAFAPAEAAAERSAHPTQHASSGGHANPIAQKGLPLAQPLALPGSAVPVPLGSGLKPLGATLSSGALSPNVHAQASAGLHRGGTHARGSVPGISELQSAPQNPLHQDSPIQQIRPTAPPAASLHYPNRLEPPASSPTGAAPALRPATGTSKGTPPYPIALADPARTGASNARPALGAHSLAPSAATHPTTPAGTPPYPTAIPTPALATPTRPRGTLGSIPPPSGAIHSSRSTTSPGTPPYPTAIPSPVLATGLHGSPEGGVAATNKSRSASLLPPAIAPHSARTNQAIESPHQQPAKAGDHVPSSGAAVPPPQSKPVESRGATAQRGNDHQPTPPVLPRQAPAPDRYLPVGAPQGASPLAGTIAVSSQGPASHAATSAAIGPSLLGTPTGGAVLHPPVASPTRSIASRAVNATGTATPMRPPLADIAHQKNPAPHRAGQASAPSLPDECLPSERTIVAAPANRTRLPSVSAVHDEDETVVIPAANLPGRPPATTSGTAPQPSSTDSEDDATRVFFHQPHVETPQRATVTRAAHTTPPAEASPQRSEPLAARPPMPSEPLLTDPSELMEEIDDEAGLHEVPFSIALPASSLNRSKDPKEPETTRSGKVISAPPSAPPVARRPRLSAPSIVLKSEPIVHQEATQPTARALQHQLPSSGSRLVRIAIGIALVLIATLAVALFVNR